MFAETLSPNLLFILRLYTVVSKTHADQTLEGLKPLEALFGISCHALKYVARAMIDVALAPTFRSGQGRNQLPEGLQPFSNKRQS
jgi:hypothetical protein